MNEYEALMAAGEVGSLYIVKVETKDPEKELGTPSFGSQFHQLHTRNGGKYPHLPYGWMSHPVVEQISKHVFKEANGIEDYLPEESMKLTSSSSKLCPSIWGWRLQRMSSAE